MCLQNVSATDILNSTEFLHHVMAYKVALNDLLNL